MKRFLFSILLLGLGLSSYSQITITSTDIASPGDVIYNTTPALTVPLPPPGSNEMYNFMADSTGFEDTTYYLSPSATPYAAQMAGANLASKNGNTFTYFEKTAAGFNLRGIIFTLPDIGVALPFTSAPFRFNPSVPIMTFPATDGMNVIAQSSSRFEFNYDTNVTIGGLNAHVTKVAVIANIKDTSIIDGFGMANFPSGQVACLRNMQTQKINFTIEVFAQILIFPAAWVPFPIAGLPEYYTTNYLFWANGKKGPIANFNVDTLGNLTSASFQSQLLHVNTGIETSVVRKGFEFFPNPGSNRISWDEKQSIKNLDIFSSNGQKVFAKSVSPTQTSLLLQNFENGLYWAEFENLEGHKFRKKLIINN